MAGIRIEGNTSGNVAEVDTNNNLRATLPPLQAQAGFARLAGALGSASTDPAGEQIGRIGMSPHNRVQVGSEIIYLYEQFNATAVNSAIFTESLSTMTITQAAGVATLNAGSSVATSVYAILKTASWFPFFADVGTFMQCDLQMNLNSQTNSVTEVGFGQAATTAAPTDGAFFRYDATGVLKAVLNNNGTEYTSSALTAPSINVMHKYRVVIELERALFYIDEVLQAIIAAPTGLGFPVYAQCQPAYVRTYNSASAPSSAVTPKIGSLQIGTYDANGLGLSFADASAIGGRMGSQGQSGQTMGSTALLTNSLVAGAGAAMTNTTAALGTGLGGQFAALPTLAQGTDGIVCSYQNPVPTAAIPGKTLLIYGVTIQSTITTVLAGGPVVYEYSLAYGHTAVSLATAETLGTSKAPRRIALGLDNCGAPAANGAVGVIGQPVSRQFLAPIAVNPGEFVAIAAKNLGVVTTTGVVLFTVTFDARWV